MSNRTITSRMRVRAAIAVPVAAAALAFAPTALATTYTPANTTQFMADIAAINATPGNNTIVLANTSYFPTSPITINSGNNLEITGNPQAQPTAVTNAPVLNGQSVNPLTANFITVAPGANLLAKGFNLTTGASHGFSAVLVQGNFEAQNLELGSNTGNSLTVSSTSTQTARAVLNDSTVADQVDANSPALVNSAAPNQGTLTLNNVTVANNNGGGLSGVITMNDTLLQNNDVTNTGVNFDCFETSGQLTATNSMDSDGTCAAATSSGVTTGANLPTNGAAFNGGPSKTVLIDSTSSAYGAGGGCLPGDQRFFAGATNCSIGAFQVGGARDTSAPACTIQSINESSNPNVASTEVVNAKDSGTGLGPDAISGATTTNGTVSWPTEAGTTFDLTSPALTGNTDAPSTGNFPVTATKPVGDLTAGDTKWSFTATSWAGISTLCK